MEAAAPDPRPPARARPIRGTVRRGRTDLVADAAEHMAMLEALTAGEPDAARALVRGHFTGPGA
ncbi:FCD domain-containing protein [Streptomyces sp. NPDC051445]|uniref:FCD domain-containing protein n=1 Tax=Streptomyces sp. NPDC051445 TaxID=3365653 RepID=UPI003798CA58